MQKPRLNVSWGFLFGYDLKKATLGLAFALPLASAYLGSALYGFHQHAAQAQTAFHVCIHDLKSDFVDPGAAQ
jgi:hypothetical protein